MPDAGLGAVQVVCEGGSSIGGTAPGGVTFGLDVGGSGEEGAVDDVDAADVQTPARQVHSAPGCAPGQLPAPPPAPLAGDDPAAPAGVDVATIIHTLFWQTQVGLGAGVVHVTTGAAGVVPGMVAAPPRGAARDNSPIGGRVTVMGSGRRSSPTIRATSNSTTAASVVRSAGQLLI